MPGGCPKKKFKLSGNSEISPKLGKSDRRKALDKARHSEKKHGCQRLGEQGQGEHEQGEQGSSEEGFGEQGSSEGGCGEQGWSEEGRSEQGRGGQRSEFELSEQEQS